MFTLSDRRRKDNICELTCDKYSPNVTLRYSCFSSALQIHSFIHVWFYSPLLGPGLFFTVVIIFTQTARLLRRVISPSQGRYLYTGQHKHRINAHTDIHALSWI
jgi:hypothetical protein